MRPGETHAAPQLPSAILDTVLGHLALLFLCVTGGDPNGARQAASHMLAAYHPETPDELHLAAEIISFSAQALEALGQAATPDMPLTKILRLQSGAVSLSREAHKSRRGLDQIQKARAASAPQKEAPPNPARSPSDRPLSRPATPVLVKTWARNSQQHQAASRIAQT